MKSTRSTALHSLHSAPLLALVSAPARPFAGRSRAATPSAARLESMALAAKLWSEAHAEPGALQLTADRLELERSTVGRYATGERALPLGDVLAAPPAIGARVLRSALAHIDAQPRPLEGSVVHEAVLLVARASQLVVVLSASPLEDAAVSVLEGARDALDEMADKIARLRARVSEVIDRKRGGR